MPIEIYLQSNFTTSGGVVAVDALAAQIAEALGPSPAPQLVAEQVSISPTPPLEGMVTLDFDIALSAGQKTTLDGVVAAHTGEPLIYSVNANDLGVDMNATGVPQVKLAATVPAPGLVGGDHLVSYSCEIRVQSVIAGSFVRATLEIDQGAGFVEVVEDNWSEDQWHVLSGAFYLRGVTAGVQLAARISFLRLGLANIAEIRRSQLSVSLQEQVTP